jgi:hypothetical protein
MDSTSLMEQAEITAQTHMLSAIRHIDEILGKGYAHEHPELIAAYMRTAATGFGAAIIGRGLERIEQAIIGLDNTLARASVRG